MPTYDYRCRNCGHREEFYESIKATPRTFCPECDDESFFRVVTGGLATFIPKRGKHEGASLTKGDNWKKAQQVSDKRLARINEWNIKAPGFKGPEAPSRNTQPMSQEARLMEQLKMIGK